MTAPGEPSEPDAEGCLAALGQSRLLAPFSPEDRRRFAQYLEVLTLPEGSRVVDEASEGQDMYFILEGEARLRRAHVDLGGIGPGEYFGELSLITRRARAASVTAKTRLVLARLSRAQYQAMAEAEPALGLHFTQSLVGALGVRLTEMTDSVGLLLRERSLPRRVMVDVVIDGVTRKVKTGTPLGSLLPAEEGGLPVVAALVDRKAVSLQTPVSSEAVLAPLTTAHWEGKRIYRQSLGLLLLEAAARVDPAVPVRLGPSMGYAQRVVRTAPGGVTDDEWITRVTRMMGVLIGIDAAFRQELWTVEEARSHFEEVGWPEAAMLLRAWRTSAVWMVSCGDLYALNLTPVLPSAGPIGRIPFKLTREEGGLLLHYGDEREVGSADLVVPAARPPSQPLPAPVDGSAPPLLPRRADSGDELWLGALGVTSVGAFNEACIVGSVSQIIRVCEGLHEKRIGQIADTIAARAGQVRVICIAGPSSSGKTTFIKRLTVQLQVNGIHPAGISLDDYYLDREKTRKNDKGEYDFEAFEALDVPLLGDHLQRILAGEKVTTARYDFAQGKSLPSGGAPVFLRGTDVLLLEGIHGLNPKLLASIVDRGGIFRIFIQPTTALPFDGLSRVNVSDLRLLRRIVRDRHNRGINAAENIVRWPSVRAGEREHIFPFLDQADAVFDSALVYEPSVIKVFADRYLLEVPEDHAAYVTAYRLRQLIDRFITIYPDHVPPTSILREFIGGSGFEY
jgi:uridine kinase